jgi:ribosomal protein S27E
MGQQDKYLPKYVRSEFEAYLKCGRLEYGFFRVRCEDCHHEHLVAFSWPLLRTYAPAAFVHPANSKDERYLPCKLLHLCQSKGLRQVVHKMWQASVSMQVS